LLLVQFHQYQVNAIVFVENQAITPLRTVSFLATWMAVSLLRVFVPDRLFLRNRLQGYLSDKELQL
jgi:hypothetical protein